MCGSASESRLADGPLDAALRACTCTWARPSVAHPKRRRLEAAQVSPDWDIRLYAPRSSRHTIDHVSSRSVADSESPCPVRVDEPCRLCMAGASGPADCGLVYLVQSDVDLADRLAQLWAPYAARRTASQTPGAVTGTAHGRREGWPTRPSRTSTAWSRRAAAAPAHIWRGAARQRDGRRCRQGVLGGPEPGRYDTEGRL
jgi:hypothetical protein